MTIFFSIVLVLVVLGEFSMIYFLKKSVEKRLDQARMDWEDFVTRPDDNSSSRLEIWITQTSARLSHDIAVGIMASLRGAAGGNAKAAAAEEIEAMTSADPRIAAVQAVAPKLLKKMSKNPAALMGIQALLGGLSGGGSAPASNNGGSSSTAQFKL